MEIQSVLCNNCGASLEIDENTRFLNCGYCNSQLTVKRSESAVRTEVLDEIRESTRQMAGDLKIIQLQNQLEQLDRDWMQNRERFATRHKNGHVEYPDEKMSAVGKIGAGIGIVIFLVVAIFISAIFRFVGGGIPVVGGFFGAIPLLMIGGFVLMVIFNLTSVKSKQKQFWSERSEYEERRSEIEEKIRTLGG